MSEETNSTQEKKLSQEEIAKILKDRIKAYTAQVELLKVQETYEKLRADIEEHNLRRLVAQLRQAQIMAPDPDPNDLGDENPDGEQTPPASTEQKPVAEKKERTLKKTN